MHFISLGALSCLGVQCGGVGECWCINKCSCVLAVYLIFTGLLRAVGDLQGSQQWPVCSLLAVSSKSFDCRSVRIRSRHSVQAVVWSWSSHWNRCPQQRQLEGEQCDGSHSRWGRSGLFHQRAGHFSVGSRYVFHPHGQSFHAETLQESPQSCHFRRFHEAEFAARRQSWQWQRQRQTHPRPGPTASSSLRQIISHKQLCSVTSAMLEAIIWNIIQSFFKCFIIRTCIFFFPFFFLKRKQT